jgi:hypothetical protein
MESKSRFIRIRLLMLCALLLGTGAQAATTQFYELHRSEQPFLDGAKPVLFQTNALTYTDTDIRPDTRYYYWVRTVEMASTSKQVARQTQPGFKVTLTLKAPVKAPKNLILPVFADLDYYGADNLWPSGYGERSLYENSELPNRYLIERELSAGGTGPGDGGRLNYRRYDLDLSSHRRNSSQLSLVFRLDHQQPDEVLLVETPALAIPLTESADLAPANLRATVSPLGIKVDWNAASGVSGWSQPLTVQSGLDDQVPPGLTISAPTTNSTFTTYRGVADFSGTATDNDSVVQVTWQNHRGGSGKATGTANWTARNVAFHTGDNLIRITALDRHNNETSRYVHVHYDSQAYQGWFWNWATNLDSNPAFLSVDSRTNAVITGVITTNFFIGATELVSLATKNTSRRNPYIAKFSASQSPVWALALQSTNNLSISALSVDDDDNLVISGTCKAPAMFGTISIDDTAGQTLNYIAKFSSAGTALWVRTFEGSVTATIEDQAVDPSGNIYLGGTFSGGNLFSAPHQLVNSTSVKLLFVAKWNASGDLEWTRSATPGVENTSICLGVNSAGQTYVGGTYSDTDFVFQTVSMPVRPSTGSGVAMIFMLKLDSSGNVIWGQQGTNTHGPSGSVDFWPAIITVGPGDSAYMAGNFRRDSLKAPYYTTVGFGSQMLTASNYTSAFLAKFTSEGNAEWIKPFTNYFYNTVVDLEADQTGHVYLALNVSSQYLGTLFSLLKLNCLGEQVDSQGAQSFSGNSNVSGSDVAVHPSGNIFALGEYLYYDATFYARDTRYHPQVRLTDRLESSFLARLSPVVTNYLTTIFRQPTNQTIATGSSLTVNVGAACIGTIRYQWLKNEEEIPQATNSFFTISEAATSDSGQYRARLLTCEGIEYSDTVTISVLDRPVVENTATEFEIMNGQPLQVSFMAGGSPPLSIQWYRNGTLLPGASAPIIVIPGVQPKDAGLYHVVLTNLVGKTTNMVARVTVFDSATVLPHVRSPQIISQPQDITRALGNPFQLQVAVYGKSPFTYQWYRNDQPLPDATNRTYTVSSALGGQSGEYHVVISNDIDTVTSRKASVLIVPALLTSTWPAGSINFNQGLPLNLEVSPGTSYRLQVSSDLSNWTTLQTFQSDTALFNYLDTQAMNRTRAFYRVISP